ncbi:mechanosensitive ion channel family protein [Nitratireductor kimnyeongensis]|uniref:Small-conductance mechanosensitive channel n=1 Tax=Nitratireductor kimnyeongensis TaxID=430679 RepID=A0ABW0T3G8_9HYPH|nr:mechanosensitive ion channel domain-containing protein [Nitratireductor kimnyeongensis]QZZ35080.1 mechanosensitive ion channel [Nitratireductor kimnyeongensis]
MEKQTGRLIHTANAAVGYITEFALNYGLTFLGAGALLVIGIIAAKMLERWVRNTLSKVFSFDATLTSFLSVLARYTVVALSSVAALTQLGVPTASIIAALGAIGLAVGLALQGTLQNIAAGVMLLILRPFEVGEHVFANGISGTVSTLGLFATELKTDEGLIVFAPNSTLWNAAITNHSRNKARRVELDIDVGDGLSPEQVQTGLLKILAAEKSVLKKPDAETLFCAIEGGTSQLTLRFWTRSEGWQKSRSALTEAINKSLGKKGVSVSVPD